MLTLDPKVSSTATFVDDDPDRLAMTKDELIKFQVRDGGVH